MSTERIIILGIGCTLFMDQGLGVTVIQALRENYTFADNVELIDGGLLGVALTGTIAGADHVVAVDAFCNGGKPGDLYRLEGDRILERMTGKNHVQHVEFLEALAHCNALDHPPRTVLLGIEPGDTKTVACELSPVLQDKLDDVVACVLKELDRLETGYERKC